MLDITISSIVTDEKWFDSTLKALIYSTKQFPTKKTQLISYIPFSHPLIEYVPLRHKISSLHDWNTFHIKHYHEYVNTSFLINIHNDGFVINPSSWSNKFLEYDYIGALWPVGQCDNIINSKHYRCGNGGFSLRSKKMLEIVAKHCEYVGHPEDVTICKLYRDKLSQLGIKFATNEDAVQFSIEDTNIPENQHQNHNDRFSLTSFGFHWRHSDAIKYLESIDL